MCVTHLEYFINVLLFCVYSGKSSEISYLQWRISDTLCDRIKIMSNVSSLTAVFSNLELHLARYVYCPLQIAGNNLNLIVFSQSKLRTSSVCSWYFLAASLSSLIATNTEYLTRILTYMGSPDPSRTIGWYCTGRFYISTPSLRLSRRFLCSIVIDRFLVKSSNVKLR
jgi:hypothetical protein